MLEKSTWIMLERCSTLLFFSFHFTFFASKYFITIRLFAVRRYQMQSSFCEILSVWKKTLIGDRIFDKKLKLNMFYYLWNALEYTGEWYIMINMFVAAVEIVSHVYNNKRKYNLFLNGIFISADAEAQNKWNFLQHTSKKKPESIHHFENISGLKFVFFFSNSPLIFSMRTNSFHIVNC